MNYSKILLLGILLICSQPVFAFYLTRWEHIPIGNPDENYEEKLEYTTDYREYSKILSANTVDLDTESINEHNNSIYYAIRYNTPRGSVVAIIQSKGSKAGVVKTYTNYDEIMQKAYTYPPYTPEIAKTFKDITPDSKIYYANIVAMSKAGFNGDIDVGNADFFNYHILLKKLLKQNWHPENIDISKIKNPIILRFRVARDGSFVKCDIVQSSGSLRFDKSAVSTVKNVIQTYAHDYRTLRLPQGYNGYGVDMEYVFSYNINTNSLSVNANSEANTLYNKSIKEKEIARNTNTTKRNEPYFNSYMQDMQKTIKKYWNPPKINKKKQIVVRFTIAKNGELLSCKILKSSKISALDEAAISAIKLAAPFKPLPTEYKGTSVDVDFTFDHNIIGN